MLAGRMMQTNSVKALVYGTTDIFPTMTSDTAPSPWECYASSHDYPAWYALDDNTNNNGWYTNSRPVFPVIFSFTLNVARVVYRYTISFGTSGYNGNTYLPKDWLFQGSTNNSTWITLDTRTGETGWTTGSKRTYTFSNLTTYKYYRFSISACGTIEYCGFDQTELMEVT